MHYHSYILSGIFFCISCHFPQTKAGKADHFLPASRSAGQLRLWNFWCLHMHFCCAGVPVSSLPLHKAVCGNLKLLIVILLLLQKILRGRRLQDPDALFLSGTICFCCQSLKYSLFTKLFPRWKRAHLIFSDFMGSFGSVWGKRGDPALPQFYPYCGCWTVLE